MTKGEYSFCESATAVSTTWHIRKLTAIGKKLGGGIDTASLCGRVDPKKWNGWDVGQDVDSVPTTWLTASTNGRRHVCKTCADFFQKMHLEDQP